ncbi:hypothetical protein GCM10010967_58000 [Dyadobacter beijingensis]|uniref:Uncharacterized protein n=1 Tax=Dyadobacter beijingensis TaxID=365489 RepID=A0ABQ2IJL7_9BACT|nr:hypothetical protein [Dyadobacter beijingensis]GGN14174.1 hypothetical protein GCM10010967_58000 [Dyadobacter beijingensis]
MSEEEKRKIFEEELYRFEARHSFETKKDVSKNGKLWIFLNSNFGLWLMSTVVIGLIVGGYSKYEERKNLEIKEEEASRRLIGEMKYRVYKLGVELSYLSKEAKVASAAGSENIDEEEYRNFDYKKPINVKTIFLSIDSLFLGADGLIMTSRDKWNIFPEYKDRRLATLFSELEDSGKLKKKDNDPIAREWDQLREEFKVLADAHSKKAFLDSPEEIGVLRRRKFWSDWYLLLLRTQAQLIYWERIDE